MPPALHVPAASGELVLMTRYGQAVLLLVIAGLIFAMLRLLARRRLTMGIGLFWLTAFLGLGALVAFRPLLVLIASLLGTLYPDAAIRLLAFIALLFVQIYFSVRISMQEQRLSELGQAVALLEHELREARQANPQPAPPSSHASEPGAKAAPHIDER